MTFLSEDEIKGQSGLSMTPMLDFLFLMLMFFACLAVTRMATRDTDLSLVEIKPDNRTAVVEGENEVKLIHISILANGQYHWVTDVRNHPMQAPEQLSHELNQQYAKGLLPQRKSQTQVLLKIDKAAQWEPILKAIFAIREAGFEVYPVYEPTDG